MTILLALLGAVLFRIRGGFLPTGSTQLARAIWCVPTGALIGWLTGNWIAGLAAFFLAWAGLLLPNDPWQRMRGLAHWRDAAWIGAARVALILLPIAWATQNPLIITLGLFGAFNAPLYAAGWHLLPAEFGPRVAGSRLIDWHTAWGEAFFGALCWAIIALTVH